MPYHHFTADHAALLAAAWLILAGAGLTPAPIVLARLALRMAVRETLATVFRALLKWAAIALVAEVPAHVDSSIGHTISLTPTAFHLVGVALEFDRVGILFWVRAAKPK